MKRKTITLVMTAALLAVSGTAAMASEVTESDESSLEFMREEEKLARDVYLALGERWDAPVFENIARAEQQHMDAVLGLLDAYGIEDPALGSGKFANGELQALYDELVARGETSLEEALRVGALIEEVDIEDLKQSIAATEDDEIAVVYERLLAGRARRGLLQRDRRGLAQPRPRSGTRTEGSPVVEQDPGHHSRSDVSVRSGKKTTWWICRPSAWRPPGIPLETRLR